MNNRYSILLIDDSPDELMLVKRAIMKSRPDCAVETATDGPNALLRVHNGLIPAMIFLDLKLTGMDGFAILRALRTREEIRYTPVVILTSSTLDSDLKDAYDAGASGFIHKLHDLSRFTENIKAALHYWVDVNLTPCPQPV